MRSPPTSTQASAFWHWNSPLPYLFIGLGLMMLLISGALIILACSFRKRPSPDQEKAVSPPAAVPAADNTPKIVVILAGDDNPSHLAVPTPATCVCQV